MNAIVQTAQGFKDSGEEQEFFTIENGFSNNGEVRYTQDQQRWGALYP